MGRTVEGSGQGLLRAADGSRPEGTGQNTNSRCHAEIQTGLSKTQELSLRRSDPSCCLLYNVRSSTEFVKLRQVLHTNRTCYTSCISLASIENLNENDLIFSPLLASPVSVITHNGSYTE